MSTQAELSLNDRWTGRLADNEQALRVVFSNCSDICFHSFQLANGNAALCVYGLGICDAQRLEQQILLPLMRNSETVGSRETPQPAQAPALTALTADTVKQAVEGILEGQALVLVEGEASGKVYAVSQNLSRSTEEPAAESTVRGPRDGFTESITMNLSLLRLRIKTPALKLQTCAMGAYTSTKVTLAYIDGIIDPELVKKVLSRMGKLKLRGVLESQYIEEGIIDQRLSPFPQMITTERPDVVASNLLEGRFAIFVDGTPICLVAPATLSSMLQSPEDYYQNVYVSIFTRWMRYFFFILSLLLPSAYVAITTFHQEMIPTVLMLSIARAREEIPFPALIEALIMEICFEALREAGIRLPKQIGSAVSIVGALIIGQAATTAGIVSAPMIIIVAITGIASFMIPRYTVSITTRMLRFPVMLLAGTLGLTGVMLGIILIVIHLSSLRSFGTPYLSPITPSSGSRLKDVWWRSLLWGRSR